MTKTLMTFGDSNTYGTPPILEHGQHHRLPSVERWPVVADTALGDGWDLIEAGLPGRTTAHNCPIMGAHMNGQTGLRIALEGHGPIDLLTIMLGTNDVKTQFGLTPAAITGGIASLLSIASSEEYQLRHGGFEVMLICPPRVYEEGTLAQEFFGAEEKARQLPKLYAALAENRGIHFLDAGKFITPSAIDGVHFGAEAHVTLGKAVADAIKSS